MGVDDIFSELLEHEAYYFSIMYLASRLCKLDFILELTLSLIGVTISVLSSRRTGY